MALSPNEGASSETKPLSCGTVDLTTLETPTRIKVEKDATAAETPQLSIINYVFWKELCILND